MRTRSKTSSETSEGAFTLSDVLDELSTYGHPTLMQFNDGRWMCKVERKDLTRGLEIAVKSKYDHLTSLEAVLLCLDRVRATCDKPILEHKT